MEAIGEGGRSNYTPIHETSREKQQILEYLNASIAYARKAMSPWPGSVEMACVRT